MTGAVLRPAGRNRDAPRDRPLLAKAAAPDYKGADARSSPSMRVAARTAKRRAGLPARQEATVAPRSSPTAAGKPRANASSRAPAKPAQTRTSSESDSDEDSELPSGSDEDSAMEEDIDESLSDATEAMAARCFGRYAAPRRAYDGLDYPRCPSGAPLPGGDYVLNDLFTTGGRPVSRVRAATAPEPSTATEAPAKERREKRNKYAEFSRADDEYGAKFERGELGGPDQKKSRVRRRPISSRGDAERDLVVYPDAGAIDPQDPSSFGFCEIGRVIGAHGVNGYLKVQSDTDFGEQRLCTPGARYLKLPTRRAPREVVISSGSRAKTLPAGLGAIFIVRMDGVDGREDAHALKGCVLYVREDDTPTRLAREEQEYLVREIVGCEVRLMPDGAEYVGVVVGMVCSNEISGVAGLGNDLLDVEKAAPPGGGKPDRIYIPFVAALCPKVDLEAKLILIAPPPGLLELIQPPEVLEVFVRGLLPAVGESSARRE
ncbi:hypothetical protein T492DRAFT_909465 [Pavlovales sp. CCMP2436]|nr:hypothetical protein T492DRAFT_909465 [Pavlovales sp. CCMP2436]